MRRPKGSIEPSRVPIKSRKSTSDSSGSTQRRHRGAMELGWNKEGIPYFRQPMAGLGFITWHVYPKGEAIIRRWGLVEGNVLPSDLFRILHDGGHLYTLKGGPSGYVEPTQTYSPSPNRGSTVRTPQHVEPKPRPGRSTPGRGVTLPASGLNERFDSPARTELLRRNAAGSLPAASPRSSHKSRTKRRGVTPPQPALEARLQLAPAHPRTTGPVEPTGARPAMQRPGKPLSTPPESIKRNSLRSAHRTKPEPRSDAEAAIKQVLQRPTQSLIRCLEGRISQLDGSHARVKGRTVPTHPRHDPPVFDAVSQPDRSLREPSSHHLGQRRETERERTQASLGLIRTLQTRMGQIEAMRSSAAPAPESRPDVTVPATVIAELTPARRVADALVSQASAPPVFTGQNVRATVPTAEYAIDEEPPVIGRLSRQNPVNWLWAILLVLGLVLVTFIAIGR